MDISSIALQGLDQANVQLDAAAAQIVDASTTASTGGIDLVNLSEEMVALMTAQNSFDANLATLQTANEVQKSLVDLTA
jgi:flagellar basal body rod protein FlgG